MKNKKKSLLLLNLEYEINFSQSTVCNCYCIFCNRKTGFDDNLKNYWYTKCILICCRVDISNMINYKNNTKYLFKSLKRLFSQGIKEGIERGEGGEMIELINKKTSLHFKKIFGRFLTLKLGYFCV